jgi:phosphonate transport system substrate-binding protein
VLMVRRDAPESVKAALQNIFFNYGKTAPDERELLKRASGIERFVQTDNRLLEPVSEFKFATERAAVQANPALSATDKTTQLVRMDQRASAFKAALASVR